MKSFKILMLIFLSLGLSSCANMSQTQQRTVTGGLGGAGVGAVIGAFAGSAGMGAAIGAAVGTAGGYLYGKHKESEQQAYNKGRQDEWKQQQQQQQPPQQYR